MLQFTPNPRASGNLSLAANLRARMSSIVSLDWDHVTDKPDFDALYAPLGADYEVTSGASAVVANDARTVRINKSVGGAISVQLPAAINKSGPVLIADWKGDAGTNNITISPAGSEKIQGLSSWIIASDTGSIFLRPIPGVGYVI
jgi:hypothetical protein